MRSPTYLPAFTGEKNLSHPLCKIGSRYPGTSSLFVDDLEDLTSRKVEDVQGDCRSLGWDIERYSSFTIGGLGEGSRRCFRSHCFLELPMLGLRPLEWHLAPWLVELGARRS